MQRISISYSKFATSRSGGARESLLTLLRGVAKEVHITADVYQTPPVDNRPDTNFEYNIHEHDLHEIPKLTWTNQVFTRKQWGKYLRWKLTPEHDLLITQNALAPISVQVADELNIPSLFFIRSMALTGYEKYDPKRGHLSNLFQTDLGGRVQYPFLWKNFHDYRRAAVTATHTIANSEFTAAKIEDLFGVEATVIYPPIKLENYKVEYSQNGYITMVNPRAEYKGPDIFLDIADESPDEEFLLVGPISSESIKKRAEHTPNVIHWEWCDDMREAYGESKLVVVPSRWEEPFGRVPAEAMVSGIPCVVSNRGGLPWVVGETGEVVTEIESTNHWKDAIHNALSTYDPEAQMRRVEMFSADSQVEKLCDMINQVQED
jgi:glycosyltransferase involved in cell wall biosynthesis